MKVLPFKIPKPDSAALIYQEDYGERFYDKLHQHEEIQLSYILEGEGTLIVGDSVSYYKTTDFIVIGSNIPHVFKSDQGLNKTSHMLSLFFTKTSFGNIFFDLEELKDLNTFFKRERYGFKVLSHKNKVKHLFLELNDCPKINRFIILLQLLKVASKGTFERLSSFVYDKDYSDAEGTRMRNVFEYTILHFNDSISLKTIANVANMTKNAFCKYFKKRTNKTYFQFLNELRIEQACKLLHSEIDLPIADIANKCGYYNLSNFNRKFKLIKHITPSEYRLKL